MPASLYRYARRTESIAESANSLTKKRDGGPAAGAALNRRRHAAVLPYQRQIAYLGPRGPLKLDDARYRSTIGERSIVQASTDDGRRGCFLHTVGSPHFQGFSNGLRIQSIDGERPLQVRIANR